MATSHRLARSSSAPNLLPFPLTRQCPYGPPTTCITVTADAPLSRLPCCPPALPDPLLAALPACSLPCMASVCHPKCLVAVIALVQDAILTSSLLHTTWLIMHAHCKCKLELVLTRNSKGRLEEVGKASVEFVLVLSASFTSAFAVPVRNVFEPLLTYFWHGSDEILAWLLSVS